MRVLLISVALVVAIIACAVSVSHADPITPTDPVPTTARERLIAFYEAFMANETSHRQKRVAVDLITSTFPGPTTVYYDKFFQFTWDNTRDPCIGMIDPDHGWGIITMLCEDYPLHNAHFRSGYTIPYRTWGGGRWSATLDGNGFRHTAYGATTSHWSINIIHEFEDTTPSPDVLYTYNTQRA